MFLYFSCEFIYSGCDLIAIWYFVLLFSPLSYTLSVYFIFDKRPVSYDKISKKIKVPASPSPSYYEMAQRLQNPRNIQPIHHLMRKGNSKHLERRSENLPSCILSSRCSWFHCVNPWKQGASLNICSRTEDSMKLKWMDWN